MRPATAPSRPRLAPVLAVLAAAVLAGALAGACGAGAAEPPDPAAASVPSATRVVEEPVVRPGDAVPAPSGAAVLTVSGRISVTNDGTVLRLDPAALDQLGRVQAHVYEPWVKKALDFQGVWLDDLLDVAGINPAASTVHLTALDDYQVDLSVADVMAGGVLLATRTGDGAPIPVEDGGPTRVVFVGGVPVGSSAEKWIWSLSTIDVR